MAHVGQERGLRARGFARGLDGDGQLLRAPFDRCFEALGGAQQALAHRFLGGRGVGHLLPAAGDLHRAIEVEPADALALRSQLPQRTGKPLRPAQRHPGRERDGHEQDGREGHPLRRADEREVGFGCHDDDVERCASRELDPGEIGEPRLARGLQPQARPGVRSLRAPELECGVEHGLAQVGDRLEQQAGCARVGDRGNAARQPHDVAVGGQHGGKAMRAHLQAAGELRDVVEGQVGRAGVHATVRRPPLHDRRQAGLAGRAEHERGRPDHVGARRGFMDLAEPGPLPRVVVTVADLALDELPVPGPARIDFRAAVDIRIGRPRTKDVRRRLVQQHFAAAVVRDGDRGGIGFVHQLRAEQADDAGFVAGREHAQRAPVAAQPGDRVHALEQAGQRGIDLARRAIEFGLGDGTSGGLVQEGLHAAEGQRQRQGGDGQRGRQQAPSDRDVARGRVALVVGKYPHQSSADGNSTALRCRPASGSTMTNPLRAAIDGPPERERQAVSPRELNECQLMSLVDLRAHGRCVAAKAVHRPASAAGALFVGPAATPAAQKHKMARQSWAGRVDIPGRTRSIAGACAPASGSRLASHNTHKP